MSVLKMRTNSCEKLQPLSFTILQQLNCSGNLSPNLSVTTNDHQETFGNNTPCRKNIALPINWIISVMKVAQTGVWALNADDTHILLFLNVGSHMCVDQLGPISHSGTYEKCSPSFELPVSATGQVCQPGLS